MAQRAMWAMGDYDRFARATVWQLGPILTEACGITAGQRVLDVAAGTGNVAIRAARTGASVVAADLAPEHFVAGRRNAAEAGVDVEWVEGDAEALPFDDDSFDVVTSCFGAMFAPHHQRVASELVRVCRPGGTIGLMAFTPDGIGAEFFGLLAPYMPPPSPGAEQPPLLWGDEAHVRGLFGSRVQSLNITRRTYVESAPSPQDYRRLFQETFPPLVAIRGALEDAPDRQAELDRTFLEAIVRWGGGRDLAPVEVTYPYLLVIARRTSDLLTGEDR
jgi:SAM-dependent methyltransferase